MGRHSSRGCIRLYPADIAALYPIVAIGTPVRVVNEPIKLGWIGGELYLEVNPDADESLELDETAKVAVPKAAQGPARAGEEGGRKDLPRVDWARVDRTGENRLGIPVRVTTPVRRRARRLSRPEKIACPRPACVCNDRYRTDRGDRRWTHRATATR